MGANQGGRALQLLTERRKRELQRLAVMFIAMLILSWHLSGVLGRAWVTRGLPWHLLVGGSRMVGLGVDAAVVFPLGLYFGLLVLLPIDALKRTQGILLGLATVVGFAVLLSLGRFDAIDLAVAARPFLAGLAIGLLAGGGYELYDSSAPYTFPRATTGIYYVLSAIVVVGIVEFHLRYTSPVRFPGGQLVVGPVTDVQFVAAGLLTNVVAGGLFIVVLRRFTQYESSATFTVLGPQRSGKTTLMTGLFTHALSPGSSSNLRLRDINGSESLRAKRQQLVAATEGFGGIDESTETDEGDELRFQFIRGRIFPIRNYILTIDYAGEKFTDALVEELSSQLEDSGLLSGLTGAREGTPAETDADDSDLDLDIGGGDDSATTTDGGTVDSETIHERLATNIIGSEKLVLVLPLNHFIETSPNEDLKARTPSYYEEPIDDWLDNQYIVNYENILGECFDAGMDKDIVMVATRADTLLEAFEEDRLRDGQEYSEARNDYPLFKEYVNEKCFSDDRLEVIRQAADNPEVYPVCFQPNREHPTTTDGQMNPQRDDGINVIGAEQLLNELGGR